MPGELEEVVRQAAEQAGCDPSLSSSVADALSRLGESSKGRVPVGQILLRVLTLLPEDLMSPPGKFERRKTLKFEVRQQQTGKALEFVKGQPRFSIDPKTVAEAIHQSNASLLALQQFTAILRVPVSELLGMRNLSSLVSSVMVSELAAIYGDLVYPNPHQDGIPDLIPKTRESLRYYEEMRKEHRLNDKSAWTKHEFGGIEVKATCGNTPAARVERKLILGEERSKIIVGYDWKAHHRETTTLLAVVWDFVDSVPTITAAFYRNDLDVSDWGAIVSPKEGGGRTTSVSIMPRQGITKMAQGWIVRPLDKDLRKALERGRLLGDLMMFT